LKRRLSEGVQVASASKRLQPPRNLRLERIWLGVGATGKSGALVRTHCTNQHESWLAFESP